MLQIQLFKRCFAMASYFFSLEASAGILLFFTAILAFIFDNSFLHNFYQAVTHASTTWYFLHWHFVVSSHFWVNDVLMVIFFLLVGLEIKREICRGELNSIGKIALPAIAAVGGMVVPALIYLAFNSHDPIAIRGWAIPTATDIAFALAIVALLGKRVPIALKVYLMALAIFDDLGAILIIAVFYQTQLSWPAVGGIFLCMGVLFICNRLGVKFLAVYLFLGVILWGFFLASGIHPTLAGVILALLIPLKNKNNPNQSPLHRLESKLHPWVAYGILPLFAFVNAGISVASINSELFLGATSLGVVMGLFLGKQIGVFVATWLAIRSGMAPMPKGASWSSLYAIALICGVGFTISLFISDLAFAQINEAYATVARLGVLIGSCLSGVMGYFLLNYLYPKQ
jgi:NhaA family Na+:H+ antiporter